MKRRLIVLVTVVGMAMFSLMPAASAETCDTGHEYAQAHIVPLATSGALGHGGHVPGSHQGFSNVPPAC